ncbi:cysteine desulfurase [Orenia metallireducens]|uniref:cysteine desulfurase n=1 Tax=Orenia metallireducens TaxID=1413210 RepID=A0A1C0AAC9_9FIRM|nr:aminotransferase class V-fold PLP-dependent enzyme [Orenia metallireducens]OCL27240.1 cysteine desulfurase [Orenia metallireducens]
MIYVNNAATTCPKPERVYQAINSCMREVGYNPGRSGGVGISRIEREIFDVRSKVAKLINAPNSSRVIFTSGATEALNLGIKGILKQDDHVITTELEHNSVLRPLRKLERSNMIELSIVQVDQKGRLNLKQLEDQIQENTRLIVTTHASNVIGNVIDIGRIGELAHQRGITYLVDAAQTAGVVEIDIEEMKIDLLALAGHKSLYGPTGIGALYIKEGVELDTLIEGGTGSDSLSTYQPILLPDRYEAGTLNTMGIIGLGAGIDFLMETGVAKIRAEELELAKRFITGLEKIDDIIIYGDLDVEERVGVVSFNLKGIAAADVAYILENQFDILVRAGLHCAPLLHQALNTKDIGMVRVSFSYFNTEEEVDIILDVLSKISKDKEEFSL